MTCMRIGLAIFSILMIWGAFVSCSKEEEVKRVPLATKSISAKTIEVVKENLPQYNAFPGQVTPKIRIVLSAKAPGYVRSVAVREGDRVNRGDVVVRLDDKGLRARLEGLREKKAALEREKSAYSQELSYREATFRRIKALFKDEAATKDEFDRARAAYFAAKERLRAYEAQIKAVEQEMEAVRHELTYCIIRAPQSGEVTRRVVDPGTFVGPGSPLLQITSRDAGFWFEAQIPESYYGKIGEGDSVYVTIDEGEKGNEYPRRVTLTRIVPEIDPKTRTFKVKVDLGVQDRLKGGMFGTIWLKGENVDGILVPEAVLVKKGGIKGVYAVEKDGTIYFQVVTVGGCYHRKENVLFPCVHSGDIKANTTPRELVITSGLSPGMRVCSTRLEEIREGMSLE